MVVKCLVAAVLAVVCTTNALSAPKELDYKMLATFRAQLQVCYTENFVSPQFFADSDRAVDSFMRQITFDREKLHDMTMSIWNETTAETQLCRDTEVAGYQLQAKTKQMVINNNQSQADFQGAVDNFKNSNPKPIYCNRIGTQTFCN